MKEWFEQSLFHLVLGMACFFYLWKKLREKAPGLTGQTEQLAKRKALGLIAKLLK
jgi:hypothetical protein